MTPGEEVEALIGGESCGTATVTAAGEWVIVVQPGAPCQPSQGAEVTFTVNGAPAAESETWRPGGVPADLVAGMTLTVGEPAPKSLPVPAVSAFAGDLPAEGFGLVTFGGSVDELKAALAVECASGAPIFATVGGGSWRSSRRPRPALRTQRSTRCSQATPSRRGRRCSAATAGRKPQGAHGAARSRGGASRPGRAAAQPLPHT